MTWRIWGSPMTSETTINNQINPYQTFQLWWLNHVKANFQSDSPHLRQIQVGLPGPGSQKWQISSGFCQQALVVKNEAWDVIWCAGIGCVYIYIIPIIHIYDMTIVWIFEGWTWMHWVAIQNLCLFFLEKIMGLKATYLALGRLEMVHWWVASTR